MFEKNIKITAHEQKALADMMKSCTEDATKALSEMVNRKVEIRSISVEIMRLNDVPNLMSPNDTTTTALFTKLSGTINCVIVLSTTLKNILQMADIFLHKETGYFKDLSETNISVIKEFAGILTGYYISALNTALGAEYVSVIPALSVNPHRAIEDFGFGQIYTETINALVLEANIWIPADEIDEKIIIVFEANNLKRIVSRAMNKL